MIDHINNCIQFRVNYALILRCLWESCCLQKYKWDHSGQQYIIDDYFFTAHSMVFRIDSRLAPSQWETSLQSNTVSHWLGANLESALVLMDEIHVWQIWWTKRNGNASGCHQPYAGWWYECRFGIMYTNDQWQNMSKNCLTLQERPSE